MPKDRKVLGNGVTILAVGTRRSMHTTAVMRSEREVSQNQSTSSERNLSSGGGIAALEELSRLSKTGKVKVWHVLLNPDIHQLAYNSILTPEIDSKTTSKLKQHSYQFNPIRSV